MRNLLILIIILSLFVGCISPPTSPVQEVNKSSDKPANDVTEKKPPVQETKEEDLLPTVPEEKPIIAPPTVNVGCTDSDGGEDIFAEGKTENDYESIVDTCLDNKRVQEYYCTGDKIEKKPLLCPDSYVCKIGACVKLEIKTVNCVDSDGQDFFTKGQVTANGDSYYDKCASSDNVVEYYCDNGAVKTLIRGCAINESCKDGKCIKNLQKCADSDGGENRDVLGHVNITSPGIITTYTDQCSTSTIVHEYFCTGQNVNYTLMPCSLEKHCFYGVCVS